MFVYEKKRGGARHIWLAITAEPWRRHGVMRALLDAAIARLPRDVAELTVTTSPEKFPGMPKFLARQGFEFCGLKDGAWHMYAKPINRQ